MQPKSSPEKKAKELAKIAIDEKTVSAIRFIDQRMDLSYSTEIFGMEAT